MKVLVIDDGSALARALVAEVSKAGHEVLVMDERLDGTCTTDDSIAVLHAGELGVFKGVTIHTSPELEAFDRGMYDRLTASIGYRGRADGVRPPAPKMHYGGKHVAQWKQETRGRNRR